MCGRVLLWWWCPLVAYVPDSGPAGPAGGWLWSSGGALHAFCPLYCFALCRVACEYGSISRFKGVLRGFWGVGVYSYGFGVLRGLCGFCARVELGGYMTCGVFASILSSFVLFCPLLSSFLSFCSCVCLSFYLFVPAFFVCPLVLCLSSLSLWVVVSFSLTVYAQKERAQSVFASSLVLLCVALFGCCFIFLVLFRCQPVYIVIKF